MWMRGRQAGIRKAQSAADAANQLAMAANTQAENANTAAQNASNHVNQINTTVNGLDQYKQATDLVIKFRGSSPVLTADSKAAAGSAGLEPYRARRLHPGNGSALAIGGQRRHTELPSAWRKQSSAISYRNIRFPSTACTPWPSATKLRWPQPQPAIKTKSRSGYGSAVCICVLMENSLAAQAAASPQSAPAAAGTEQP